MWFRVGRVKVDSYLQLLDGDPSVLVLGDMASFKDENENPLPDLAPVAVRPSKRAVSGFLDTSRG
jgi:NADH dehydrogenase FAD-containing subunit